MSEVIVMAHRRIGRIGMLLTMSVLCVCSLSCADPPTSGADYAARRNAMVDGIVGRYSIEDDTVVQALRSIPRHLFVPANVRESAYVDTPLPIGNEQTISAPSIVAVMTDLLRPRPDHVVLEVGTGSGYQAAVLSPLVKHVYTTEIVEPLAHSARARLRELGYENVTVRAGDGYRGWPDHAPFDGIIVTCAPERIPEPLVEQLKEGGRMVIPVGDENGAQDLYLLTKQRGEVVKQAVLPVVFVPMTGEARDDPGR